MLMMKVSILLIMIFMALVSLIPIQVYATQTVDSCTTVCVSVNGAVVSDIYSSVSLCTNGGTCETGQTFTVPSGTGYVLRQAQFQIQTIIGTPTGSVSAA